jgi:cellulose synthase/poly-beta-1,6-N-acetylglucosamine synthase-like glycosyltransferase
VNSGVQSDETSLLGIADFIVPVFNERPVAVEQTLRACLNQTYPVSKIFVVDDGSANPVDVAGLVGHVAKIELIRLERNMGISVARNSALALSRAKFVACVNTEVVPAPEWLASCAGYLSHHPKVGACYTRLLPFQPDRLLTKWRMRFQEPKFPEDSCRASFATGHAVLFRKDAIDSVGGYDLHFKRIHEDSDICKRMWNAGWETHYVSESHCVSIQRDSLLELANKQLRDSNWLSPKESSLVRLYVHLTRWTIVRFGRNVVRGRLHFLLVDLALWAVALSIATCRTLRAIGSSEISLRD